LRDANGVKIGVDAIALDNGDRFPIVRPSKEDIAAGSCGLDQSILTESSIALRRAIEAKVNLLIFEKFGECEQLGEGLADDILPRSNLHFQAIAIDYSPMPDRACKSCHLCKSSPPKTLPRG